MLRHCCSKQIFEEAILSSDEMLTVSRDAGSCAADPGHVWEKLYFI